MKQVNFSHEGGFPLEQETLERLQTAYRSELYEAFKSHLGLKTDKNYIIAHATATAKGWAVINKDENNSPLPGTLYPIKEGENTGYLKTSQKGTSLVYGNNTSQIAYFDYEAEYIESTEYQNRPTNPNNTNASTVYYFNLGNTENFEVIADHKTIETTIIDIKNSYLPLNGSKAMEGDLDLGEYHLSKLDTLENYFANVRAADFKFGSKERRGQLHPDDILGRALVDSSDATKTNLTLNHASDWQHTTIGGKVYFDNLNTNTEDFTSSNSSPNSLLVMDNANQVHKSNNLLNSLLSRISKLETQTPSAVPIGMIAIWGKPAPFPEGWEEYVPLRGRMPIGFDEFQSEFNSIAKEGGAKNKTLTVPELPPHSHTYEKAIVGRGYDFQDRTPPFSGLETANTSTVGNGQAFSILNPYRVVHFIEYTGKPSDKTAPTTPTNLTLLNATSTTAYFSWAASTDNVGVDKYLIYKNGQPTPIGEVYGSELSYTAYNLDVETQYTFTVAAKDVAGNISPQSQPLSVTTANVSTIIPANLFVELLNNEVYLNWDVPVDPGVISYEIWRRIPGGTSSLIGTSSRMSPYYYDYGAVNVTYLYKIRSKHVSGNYSGFTEEVIITKGNTSCFDIESPVTMASGQSKKLKNVVVGDKLQGFSFPNEMNETDGNYMLWNGLLSEASKAEVIVVAKQTSIQPDYYKIKTADNIIKVTAEHPLLVTEDGENVKWVNVKNISENMSLIDKVGKPKAIESIVFIEEPLEVALLDVETVDNYIISGILAHNKEMEPALN